MTSTTTWAGEPFDRRIMEQLMRRRLFYTPSFEIYQGVKGIELKGLYDYGPPGCSLQANIIDLWRKHFILEEDMLELDCTSLTPHEVLKTSGHVDKFSDWMCKDPKTGDIFRADHLVKEVLESRLNGDKEARGQAIEQKEDDPKKKKKKKVKETKVLKLDDPVVQEYNEVLAQLDNYDGPALGKLIDKYQIKNPETDGPLNPPIAFNLMFETAIGPSGSAKGYLRPETAQGQFLNFAKLLEWNQHAMPFASATIGKSFRNEISPRSGLIRVREFLMAEIEHFVDPDGGKAHPRFKEIQHMQLTLLNRETQLSGRTDTQKVSLGDAVRTGLVDNETLGYFLARINLFLSKLGVDPSKLRFRQHMANEMAHYAADCWDAELFTSYGWIECVGCADRSAYDLTVHAERTGAPLVVRESLKEPLTITEYAIEIDKKTFGPKFKRDASAIETHLNSLSQSDRKTCSATLSQNQPISLPIPPLGDISLPPNLLSIPLRTTTSHTRTYTPNVIEPSFGIGRILYALLEHVFWTRPSDAARCVLSIPAPLAPTKVLLVPLSSNPAFSPSIATLQTRLRAAGIAARVDDSGASIGKRYARNDELGTPLGVTVDFQSVRDSTYTLRDRDSTRQVRAGLDEILTAISGVCAGTESWDAVEARLPKFEAQEVEDE